jgi:hypothetical protein
MPRDSSGNYTLPVSGNPVVSGETVSSAWANSTLDDVAVAMTDSLDREGRGGMLSPFRFADGTNLLPGASWVNETTTGFYRFDGGDLRIGVLTQQIQRWQATGSQLWNFTTLQWENILTTSPSAGQVLVPPGVDTGDKLAWDNGSGLWVIAPVANNLFVPRGTVDLTLMTWDDGGQIWSPNLEVTISGGGLITATLGFAGPLTGDVTGNLTGNVTGDVTGNVIGDVTGDLTGNADTATNATTAASCTGNSATATLATDSLAINGVDLTLTAVDTFVIGPAPSGAANTTVTFVI